MTRPAKAFSNEAEAGSRQENASKEEIRLKAQQTMDSFGRNHIFNLGHGVYPDTDYSHVQALIQSVKSYRYQ